MKRHYESIINQSTRVSRCSSIRSKIHIYTLCSKLDHKILRSSFKMRLTPKPRFKRTRCSKIITLFLGFHKIDLGCCYLWLLHSNTHAAQFLKNMTIKINPLPYILNWIICNRCCHRILTGPKKKMYFERKALLE